jgi:hypothetical protein
MMRRNRPVLLRATFRSQNHCSFASVDPEKSGLADLAETPELSAEHLAARRRYAM